VQPTDPTVSPRAESGAGLEPLAQLERSCAGVDTHAHVFLHNAKMIEGRRYTVAYGAPLPDYLTMLDANGMSHGVLTPVSIFGTDNSYILQALQQEPTRLRGIVAVTPDIDVAELRAMDRVGVVGVRLNVIGLPNPDFANSEWKEHLRHVADLGWQVEIQCEARRLPDIVPHLLVAGVDVVIDHFGRPDEALGVTDPGFQYLLTVGQSGRVWVKLSGAYRNGLSEGARIAAAATRLLLHHFGRERLMWGSDWPHTCFEHPDAPRLAREALDKWVLSDADRQAVLVETPYRLFRFGSKPRVIRF